MDIHALMHAVGQQARDAAVAMARAATAQKKSGIK